MKFCITTRIILITTLLCWLTMASSVIGFTAHLTRRAKVKLTYTHVNVTKPEGEADTDEDQVSSEEEEAEEDEEDEEEMIKFVSSSSLSITPSSSYSLWPPTSLPSSRHPSSSATKLHAHAAAAVPSNYSTRSKAPSIITQDTSLITLLRSVVSFVFKMPSALSNSQLIADTRSAANPVVILLHGLGIYLSLQAMDQSNMFFFILLQEPAIWMTLLVLLLTSATCMFVDDYFDYSSSYTANFYLAKMIPRVNPLLKVTSFVESRHGVKLLVTFLATCLVPGDMTKIFVFLGLSLTFWYSVLLKSEGWLKNIVCASLVALAPLASGAATLSLMFETDKVFSFLTMLHFHDLMRFVSILFLGILAREIFMDIPEVNEDQIRGIRTVPVAFGRHFASGMTLVCTAILTSLAWLPAITNVFLYFQQEGNVNSKVAAAAAVMRDIAADGATGDAAAAAAAAVGGAATAAAANDLVTSGIAPLSVLIRRLVVATIGSLAQMRRAWHVFQTEGEDLDVLARAVHEGLFTMALLLANIL